MARQVAASVWPAGASMLSRQPPVVSSCAVPISAASRSAEARQSGQAAAPRSSASHCASRVNVVRRGGASSHGPTEGRPAMRRVWARSRAISISACGLAASGKSSRIAIIADALSAGPSSCGLLHRSRSGNPSAATRGSASHASPVRAASSASGRRNSAWPGRVDARSGLTAGPLRSGSETASEKVTKSAMKRSQNGRACGSALMASGTARRTMAESRIQ